MCIRVVCVLEYVYTSRRAVRSKKWPPLSSSRSPRPFSIFAFSHERRKEEEELTIDISPQLGPPTEERRKKITFKKKKEFHDSSMANCRGDRPLLLFRDGAENERKWRHKFVKLFRVSSSSFFGLFSHEESNWLLEFTRSMTTFNTL